MSRNFYKAGVQDTLLFGAEIWVMSPRIGKTIGGFNNRVDLWLAGMRPSQDTTGIWVYPPLDAVMTEVGVE